ncbi:MAG: M64 family metallopeptidase [Bacteroidales bacterium]
MHKSALIIICLMAGIIANGQETYESLRIDYIHSGDAGTENISLKAYKAEPYFSGNSKHHIFPFDYGYYKVEVSSKSDNKLLYTYQYNTLFNEWQATKRAKEEIRAFEESVRIPFPKQAIVITFYSRDTSLQWVKQNKFEIAPDSPLIIREEPTDYPSEKIHNSGDYREKLDLVIVPDGYTPEEMEKYRSDASRFASYLLECSPFDQHIDDINIWSLELTSKESGTDKPTRQEWNQTAIDASFNTFGSQRYLTTASHFKLRDAVGGTPYDLIFILVNDDLYGGGGIFNFYSTATADNSKSDFLLVHEFGHHFAGLGDEYYTSDVAVEEYHNINVEPLEPNLTTLVDFDSKWQDMVDENTPIPTPARSKYNNTTGVYEGGGYVAKNIYRPYIDCTMKSVSYDNFCPVCQRAIIQMLKYYTGEALDSRDSTDE